MTNTKSLQKTSYYPHAVKSYRPPSVRLLGLGLMLDPLPACQCNSDGAPTTGGSQSLSSPSDPLQKSMERELARAYRSTAPSISATKYFDLRAAPTAVQQFDGRMLNVWAYNNQVPGPVLRVRLGEEVHVRLRNDLPQPTTIHWHGVRVPNAMDGVPGVTQDPIPSGGDFTYRFVPKDAGTFWFHPHVRGAEQVERGLYFVAENIFEIGSLEGDRASGPLGLFYTSAVFYTSLGLGDVLPNDHVRFVVGVEALNGLLLIAWSASFLFTVMGQLGPNLIDENSDHCDAANKGTNKESMRS